MTFGISKKEIDEILLNHGIKDGGITSASDLRNAIAEVIEKNNKAIYDDVTKKVSADLTNRLKRSGLRF
jgi:Asp-tRNA(Asn)/Glu-tRNA(Gln) amidotransferase B subunit